MRYTYTYKWLIVLLFVFIFIQTLTQLLLPTLMGTIVDDGVVVGDIPYIWKIGAIMLIVAALGVVMSTVVSFYASKVAMSVGRDIREDVFRKVTYFSIHDMQSIGTASLITRTTNDITQIQQALVMVLRMFLTAPFMLIGGIAMAFMKDSKLSLVILLAMPFIIVTVYMVMKKGYPLFQAVQKRLDQLNVVLRENLTGVHVIRSFTKQKDEGKRLSEANANLMNVSIAVNRLMAFTMPFMMLLMNMTIVFIIWFGGLRIESGMMEIGDLMAFIQYVMLILMALMMASMMFVIIPRASVSANRIREVLELETEKKSLGEKRLGESSITVTFRDLSFAYPDADQLALSGVNFTAKPGEMTAIIGGTGSGKTTLIQLLPRFYHVREGQILFNNEPIDWYDETDLRENIGYVAQQALLFSGTVKENLRYGKETASDEEIVAAAKIAQAHDFIMQLPNGYESYIEQGGANLSGGQKQRLSIARAIVRRPALYIFDDSFSALDYTTDRKLRDALASETEKATVIVVAQRISSVIDADQIIVLDKGKMVGKGTHDELLETCEVYKEIVASQMGEGEGA
ncbi:MAG TPA: ABC transporter ATP-binding protein [Pseudogracilibacillus sp.]|nr:ABC transporter ATP-binding protein [Pseudogracilibacillus sp.]